MIKLSHRFKGIFNIYQYIYPHNWLEDTMNTCPEVNHLILKLVDNGLHLFAVGIKILQKRCFKKLRFVAQYLPERYMKNNWMFYMVKIPNILNLALNWLQHFLSIKIRSILTTMQGNKISGLRRCGWRKIIFSGWFFLSSFFCERSLKGIQATY